MSNDIFDTRFRCRAMGMTGAASDDEARKWHAAAVGNPQRIAMAAGHFTTLLDMLPTPEDAARVRAEVKRRNAAPFDPKVFDSQGTEIGQWAAVLVSGSYRLKYHGRCPCESGEMFLDCHGADESNAAPIAANAGNAQDAPGEEPT